MSKREFRYSKFFEPKKYRYLILMVVFILLGQDLILELPVLFNKLQAVRFKGEAIGKIEKIKPQRIIRQTLTGNRTITTGYEISYTFSVNDIKYQGKTFIPNGTTQYASTFRHLYNSDKITVKYNPENPSINTIDLPYEDTFLSM